MIEFMTGLPGPLLHLALAALLIAESGLAIGVFLPAATTVLTVGALARFDVVPVVTIAATVALSSAVGSQVGYLRGRARQGPLWRATTRRLGSTRTSALLNGLERRAAMTLAVCQCLGVLRTVAPRLAAQAGVPRLRHAVITAAAAAVWACTLITLGWTAGDAYHRTELAVSMAGLPALCIAGILLIITVAVRNRLRTKRDRAGREEIDGDRAVNL
ncbi:DedA family protein [Amycolatopsis sp. NPDC052450]|uniref:DedA family protein n=1 Tax=Amycolatopsis sp. NPDC052450 TaxID=3363937 RepID=UPI0037C88A24